MLSPSLSVSSTPHGWGDISTSSSGVLGSDELVNTSVQAATFKLVVPHQRQKENYRH